MRRSVPERASRASRVASSCSKDELSGQTHRIAARAVINAGGVWSGKVAELFPTAAPPIKLKPSRGSHLVLKPTA
ncbi:MAG: FAD-dependent oxidoreductase [Marmoricola sp.]